MFGDHSLPLAEVILGSDASARLRPLGSRPPFVSLGQDVPGGPAPVVDADEYRVGVLSPRDSQRYQPVLQAARRAGRALFVQCRLSDDPDAPLRLQIHPAGIL